MSTHLHFTTLVEMFDQLRILRGGEQRSVLQYRSEGAYRSVSFGELQQMVRACAHGFASLGIGKGDRVAIIADNRPEWVVADFALIHLGAVNVSIYPTLSAKQIEFILCDSGARAAIVSGAAILRKVLPLKSSVSSLRDLIQFGEGNGAENEVLSWGELLERGREFSSRHPRFWENERPAIAPEDLLTLIYTSGTTGNPKGVMLTHGNLASNIVASAASLDFTDRDNILSFLPLCHSYERMAGYYTAMACGVNIAYAESIDRVADNLLEIRPTVVTSVPRLLERFYHRLMKRIDASPAWRQILFHDAVSVGLRFQQERRSGVLSPWLRARHALADRLVFRPIRERLGGRIRFFVSGGAALSPVLGEFFEAIGVLVLEGYGMTESSPVISFNRLDNYRFGTVGHPIPGVEVRLSDDGEILCRGPNVMRGYWNNEEATREAIDAGGWLHTGDIGTIDEEGFLSITDRKKHLFVSSGGKNIAPQHIESLFLQHPLIDQFVLVGDGRLFLTALIVPDFEALRDLARRLGISATSVSELVHDERITRHFEREMNALQRDLASFERVRRFALLDHALTLEGGELTPSQKVRRKFVEEKYRDLIEEMYADMH